MKWTLLTILLISLSAWPLHSQEYHFLLQRNQTGAIKLKLAPLKIDSTTTQCLKNFFTILQTTGGEISRSPQCTFVEQAHQIHPICSFDFTPSMNLTGARVASVQFKLNPQCTPKTDEHQIVHFSIEYVNSSPRLLAENSDIRLFSEDLIILRPHQSYVDAEADKVTNILTESSAGGTLSAWQCDDAGVCSAKIKFQNNVDTVQASLRLSDGGSHSIPQTVRFTRKSIFYFPTQIQHTLPIGQNTFYVVLEEGKHFQGHNYPLFPQSLSIIRQQGAHQVHSRGCIIPTNSDPIRCLIEVSLPSSTRNNRLTLHYTLIDRDDAKRFQRYAPLTAHKGTLSLLITRTSSQKNSVPALAPKEYPLFGTQGLFYLPMNNQLHPPTLIFSRTPIMELETSASDGPLVLACPNANFCLVPYHLKPNRTLSPIEIEYLTLPPGATIALGPERVRLMPYHALLNARTELLPKGPLNREIELTFSFAKEIHPAYTQLLSLMPIQTIELIPHPDFTLVQPIRCTQQPIFICRGRILLNKETLSTQYRLQTADPSAPLQTWLNQHSGTLKILSLKNLIAPTSQRSITLTTPFATENSIALEPKQIIGELASLASPTQITVESISTDGQLLAPFTCSSDQEICPLQIAFPPKTLLASLQLRLQNGATRPQMVTLNLRPYHKEVLSLTPTSNQITLDLLPTQHYDVRLGYATTVEISNLNHIRQIQNQNITECTAEGKCSLQLQVVPKQSVASLHYKIFVSDEMVAEGSLQVHLTSGHSN